MNVQVAVRCRPLSSKEISRGCSEIVEMTDKTVSITAPPGARVDGDREKSFTFDFCYFTDSKQDQVYQDLGLSVVMKALDGFNSTIFAYGQTGSGKTFTMMGSKELPGVIPTLTREIFVHIDNKLVKLEEERKKSSESNGEEINSETKVMITVSFLEIYNEVLKDLLNPTEKQLKIREHPKNGIYVEDLCELIVKTPQDILELIDQGNTVRHVAATNMNAESSRSHSCFTIKLEQKTTTQLGAGKERNNVVTAKLNLVDLAGSERAQKTGAKGEVLKQGAMINKSLMSLGRVINALTEDTGKKKNNIPYRESKLTRLLQESLGGNSATIMIAAISPADYNFDETISTLRYAKRAKSIENKAVRNEDATEREVRNLKAEIEKLRKQLETGGGGGGGGGNTEADEELKKQIQEMEAAQHDAWEEKERLSQALEEERRSNLNNTISSMVHNVKEQKIEKMKVIKRLASEKQTLQKKQTHLKRQSDDIKRDLDGGIRNYQALQKEYEEKSASGDDVGELPVHMAMKLAEIESLREKWKDNRETFKSLKKRLEQVEEEITDERAELVATTGLLEQNDKIRKSIQEEERAKARATIDAELEAAKSKLENERSNLKNEIEREMNDNLTKLTERISELTVALSERDETLNSQEKQINEMKQYSDSLEEQLTEAVVFTESAQADAASREKMERELEALRKENEKLKIEAATINEAGSTVMREEKYSLFKKMMNFFEEERTNMNTRYNELQHVLKQATKDITYLAKENESLRSELAQAVAYEAPITH